MLKKILKKFIKTTEGKRIGIAIQANELVIVQLYQDELGEELQNFKIVKLPMGLQKNNWQNKPEELVELLQTNFSLAGVEADNIYFSLGSELFYIREITMPFLEYAELKEAVKWDALQYVPFEEDCYYYDFTYKEQLLENGTKSLRVLLVAIPKHYIDTLIEVSKRLNKRPVFITADVLALTAKISFNSPQFIYVYLQQNNAYIAYYSDNMLCCKQAFDIYNINYSLQIMDFIENKIKVRFEDSIDVFLAGDEVFVNKVQIIIDGLEEFSLQKIDSLQALKISDILDERYIKNLAPKLEESIGVALLGCGNVNLLPSRLRQEIFPFKKLVALCACLCVGILLLFATYEYIGYYLAHNRYNELMKDNNNVLLWRKRHAQVMAIQNDFTKRSDIIKNIKVSQASWHDVILALGYTTPENVYLTGISSGNKYSNWLLRGNTDDVKQLTIFIKNLEKTTAFSKVQLEQLGQQSESNKQFFTINLQLEGVVNEKSKK